jgi:hypothetical protein
VTDHSTPPAGSGWRSGNTEIDITMAHPARLDDYVTGGDDNFSVDRDVSDRIAALTPGGADELHATVVAARAFWQRVLSHLTADVGLRQYLSIGARVPGRFAFHQVAQAIAPSTRFVYLVIDPVVLARAHDLRSGTREGTVTHVCAKLRNTESILSQAAATLDFTQPVGLLLSAALPYVRRYETASRIVTELTQALAPGSYVAISHHASDIRAEELADAFRVREQLAEEGKMLGMVRRSHAEVAALFAGLELVDPGVVPLHQWRGAGDAADGAAPAAVVVPAYGGVARKP